jgi:large subunit ribosomal protein L25
VHFRGHEASPGLKRGGTLNIAIHEVEIMVPADQIPEELVADLTGLDIGDAIRATDLNLPKGAAIAPHARESVVASVATSSAMQSEEAAEAEGVAES